MTLPKKEAMQEEVTRFESAESQHGRGTEDPSERNQRRKNPVRIEERKQPQLL